MMIVIGETSLVTAVAEAGAWHRAARSGRPLDLSKMYTVRYRTYVMQRGPRTGDGSCR